VFGILQTQFYISRADRPGLDAILKEIKASQELQQQAAARWEQAGKSQHENIVIDKNYFTPMQYKAITKETRSLTADEDTLPYFRTSLGEVHAVIFPAWMIEKPEDFKDFGITKEGVSSAPAVASADVAGDSLVPAFTLRDRPEQRDRVTEDGWPRIALNLSAFESEETLRLTLFHELLHAGNIPGYSPSRFTIFQNDLTYLPEYRGYVAREGLEGWREWRLWGWWVFAPWGVSVLLALFTPWRDWPALRLLGRLRRA
jgi:hypothetical protein